MLFCFIYSLVARLRSPFILFFIVVGNDGKVHPINDYTEDEKKEMELERQDARFDREKGIGPKSNIGRKARDVDDKFREKFPQQDAIINKARDTKDRLANLPTTIKNKIKGKRNLATKEYMKQNNIKMYHRWSSNRPEGYDQPGYYDDDGNKYKFEKNKLTNDNGLDAVPKNFMKDSEGNYRKMNAGDMAKDKVNQVSRKMNKNSNTNEETPEAAQKYAQDQGWKYKGFNYWEDNSGSVYKMEGGRIIKPNGDVQVYPTDAGSLKNRRKSVTMNKKKRSKSND